MTAYKKMTAGDLRRQMLRVPDDAELLVSGCGGMHAMQFVHAVYGVRENWLNIVIEPITEWPVQPKEPGHE